MTADDYAEHPTPRMLVSESRRELRRLIEAGSFGTSGARAMRKSGGGEPLTPDEQGDRAEEFRDLDRAFEPRRKRRGGD